MDIFLHNITDLGWWLGHIPAAIVALLIAYLFKKVPLIAKRLKKASKIRDLQRIRRKRFNYSAVNYEIVKTHSLMLLFYGLCITYLFVFSKSVDTYENFFIIIIKALPLYIVEVMYLLQRFHAKELIVRVGKLKYNKTFKLPSVGTAKNAFDASAL